MHSQPFNLGHGMAFNYVQVPNFTSLLPLTPPSINFIVHVLRAGNMSTTANKPAGQRPRVRNVSAATSWCIPNAHCAPRTLGWDAIYWATPEMCRRRSPARTLAYSYALDSGGKVPLAAHRSIRGCMGSSSAGLSMSRAVAVRTK